jgi:hypothetical protein
MDNNKRNNLCNAYTSCGHYSAQGFLLRPVDLLPVFGCFGNGSLRFFAKECQEKDPETNTGERSMRKRETQGAGAEHKNRSLCTELII